MRIAIAEDYRTDAGSFARRLHGGVRLRSRGGEADTGPGRGRGGPKRTKPDLPLLDLHLPGFDGFTVIERVREEEDPPRIRVISSYGDDYTVSRIEAAAITGFIDKNGSTVAVLREALAAVAENGT